MKLYTGILALVAALPAMAAGNYETNIVTSDGYYTASPAKTKTYKKTTTTRKNGGYNNTIQNNFYYSDRPAKASSYEVVPRQGKARTTYSSASRYDDEDYVVSERRVKTVNKSYSTQERKYFLAHPFFQPLKGRFGSVTDFSYAQNHFKFDILNASILDIDPNSATYNTVIVPWGEVDLNGKAESTAFVVKEDFSVGLSDTLAVIGMVQYDKTKITLKDWSDSSPSNSASDSGVNIFGIGLQHRFADNEDWIAMIAGYFQHQKDTANTFIGELKAGYKIDRNTVYGLLRAGYSDLIDGDTYGAFVKDSSGDYMMLSYKTDVKDVFYIEGGAGVFSVLNKYLTLNGELIYGHYDWHQQLSIKGALGIQPGDMFALNLYASTSLYDSAKGKTNKYMMYDVNPEGGFATSLAYTTGDYKIKDYNEWKIGVQAILYF